MSTPPFLYLASQSPRRTALLDQLGIPHRLLLPEATGPDAEDSESLELEMPGEAPDVYVQRVTQNKLDAALARLSRRGLASGLVLCADTTVTLDGAILGKPRDAADAAAMLGRLAGRTHTVYTAIAIADSRVSAKRWAAVSRSEVTFAYISPAAIDRYVATGESFGKAGSYGIQGWAQSFISHIAGSYSGIMGLPLFEVAELLQTAGFPGGHPRSRDAGTPIHPS